MRTLQFVRVVVFAFAISLAAFFVSTLFSNSSDAYAGYSAKITQKKVSKIDEYWLALNLYYEAGTEPRIGKIAVGVVTLNRVNDPAYPKTVKDVVTEHRQFSWYNSKRVKQPPDNEVWKECLEIARMLLTRTSDSDIMRMLDGATHYHAVYVKPAWAKHKTKIVRIGDHIFYKRSKDEGIKI